MDQATASEFKLLVSGFGSMLLGAELLSTGFQFRSEWALVASLGLLFAGFVAVLRTYMQ
jgi:hypothetical protein